MSMKKIYIFYIAVVACLLSACQGLYFDNPVGKTVRFRATMANNGLTRTSYAGPEGVYSDGNKQIERINWEKGDDVDVYMYWKSTQGSAVADPKAAHQHVYDVEPGAEHSEAHVGPEGEWMSHGKLQARDGNDLKWKGDTKENGGVIFDHYFVSTYPAGASTFDWNEGEPGKSKLSFDLPKKSFDDMHYAYMAATTKVSTQEDNNYTGTVDLNYYPMVTTLLVTLKNLSTTTGGNVRVELSGTNTSKSLFGKYSVSLSNLSNNSVVATDIDQNKESALTDVSLGQSSESSESSESILFFIHPHNYSEGEVLLTIGNQSFELPQLAPCKKYNILVNLNDNGSGDIEPDPKDPPTIDDLTQGGAQLLALLIKHKLSNNKTCEILGWDDYGAFQNAIWDKLEALITNNGGEFTNISLDDLIKIFGSKDALNKLLKYIQEEWSGRYNVEITESPKISSDVSAADLQLLFPDATHLKFQVAQDGIPADRNRPITINVSGLPNLITAEFQYAEAINVDQCSSLEKITATNGDKLQLLYVNDCENLTTISIENPKALTKFSLIDTPNFEGATFNDVEKIVTVYLEDCSTNKKNVELVFKGNGNVQMDGKIRSDNVTVIRRDNGGNESRY